MSETNKKALLVQHRRGTTSDWEKHQDLVLLDGELGIQYCNDGTSLIKIGDGKTTYVNLKGLTVEGYAKDTDVILLKDRLDALIALDTTNIPLSTFESELVDARINGFKDADGNYITYETVGASIRAVGEQVDYIKQNASELLAGAKLVDGLHYENNELSLTANGTIVGDSVYITSGAGGGTIGGVDFYVRNETSGGNLFYIAKNQPLDLSFSFRSVDQGIETGTGTCEIKVDDKLRDTLRIKQGLTTLNVQPYLKDGAQTLTITCTDIYGNIRTLYYSITVIALSITSTFNEAYKYTSGTAITVNYIPTMPIDAIAYCYVDDKLYAHTLLYPSDSGIDQVFNVTPTKDFDLLHGVHKLELYLSAEVSTTEKVYSNKLIYSMMITTEGVTTPILASNFNITEVEEGDIINIPYMVYDAEREIASVKLSIISRKLTEYGQEFEDIYDETIVEVPQVQQFWRTRKYPTGNLIFRVTYLDNLDDTSDDISVSHYVKVNPSNIQVNAQTANLALYLSAAGKLNTASNRDSWYYDDALGNRITTQFTDFNWTENGWMTDSAGDTCLRISGDARAVINYKPFVGNVRSTGKTIEFEFNVHDVNKRDESIIDCLVNNTGFRFTADTAFLSTDASRIECFYKDQTRLRVSFTVDSNVSENSHNLLSVYLNGILSGVLQLSADDTLTQQSGLESNIILGSEFATLDLYSIRIYDRALTHKNIIDNYIADLSNIAEKQEVYLANAVYKDGIIDIDEMRKRIPVIEFIGEMPTYKGDKRKVRMKFTHPDYPELDFDLDNVEIDVQGTSSQFYIRKNWKIKFPKDENGQKIKWAHVPGGTETNVYCIKVDYAEATGTHNTQNANFAETLYSEKIPPQIPKSDSTEDIKFAENARTTILGYPCVIFEHVTEDDPPIFASKGNLNFDKGSEEAFGFTEDFITECWEFCNNDDPSCNFLGLIKTNWLDDFEPRYLADFTAAMDDGTIDTISFDTIEELSNENNLTEKQKIRFQFQLDKAIERFKEMHDWVLSTRRDINFDLLENKILAEPYAASNGSVYTEDSAEYRLAKFKTEFESRFNLHYTLIYYIYTFVMLMVDQRAKNMFLTYWQDSEDGSGHWYPYLYDNDTCLGINNEGKMSFTYSHEDSDDVDGALVYNGQNSTLWVNFKDAFKSEIQSMYRTLRSGNLTYDKLYNQFVTEGSDKWSAAIYNADAQYKYIGLLDMDYDSTGDNEADDGSAYLYQVRGSGEEHFKYFIQNRLNYCDSKWQGPNFNNNFIALRIYTPKSWSVIEPNPAITVTAFSDMYAGVKYKANGTLQQERLYANESHTFIPPSGLIFDADDSNITDPNYNDTETAIYGANDLSDIGDLAPLYCGTIDLTSAPRLKRLKIGDSAPGYSNPNLHKLTLSANKLLTTIDVRNCPNLKDPLILTYCTNIKEIYASGSGITSVVLPESGYVEVLDLPETITSLTLKNQLFLNNFSLPSVSKLTKLYIENCNSKTPEALYNIEGQFYTASELPLKLLDTCLKYRNPTNNRYILEKLRLIDVDLGEVTFDYLQELSTISGIDSNGIDILPHAYISGTCTVPNITGEQLQQVRTWFPYLTVHYDSLEITLTYMDETGNTELASYTYTFIDDPTTDIDESSTEFSINAVDPYASDTGISISTADKLKYCVKVSDAQYDYTYGGWSRVPGGLPEPDALKNIVSNMTFYVAFSRSLRNYKVNFYNGSELLETVIDTYKADVSYSGETPQKTDTNTPDAYVFYGWNPAPSIIPPETDFDNWELNCYAQYILKSEDGDPDTNLYTFPHTDFDFSLNTNTNTIALTKYIGVTYSIGQIPATYEINGRIYSVSEIGSNTSGVYGFENTDVEIVLLSEGILKINAEAFSDCSNLISMYIPASITEINKTAFNNTPNLSSLVVNSANAKYLSSNNAIYTHNNGNLILFKGCKETKLSVLDNIYAISDYAFSGCSELTSIVLPDSLIELGHQAFAGCSKLWTNATLTLPKTLKICNTMSLYNTGIQQLIFPDSIQTIGQYATKACRSIESISLPDLSKVNVNIHSSAFGDYSSNDTPKLKTITIRGTYEDNHNLVSSTRWGAASVTQIVYTNKTVEVTN